MISPRKCSISGMSRRNSSVACPTWANMPDRAAVAGRDLLFRHGARHRQQTLHARRQSAGIDRDAALRADLADAGDESQQAGVPVGELIRSEAEVLDLPVQLLQNAAGGRQVPVDTPASAEDDFQAVAADGPCVELPDPVFMHGRGSQSLFFAEATEQGGDRTQGAPWRQRRLFPGRVGGCRCGLRHRPTWVRRAWKNRSRRRQSRASLARGAGGRPAPAGGLRALWGRDRSAVRACGRGRAHCVRHVPVLPAAWREPGSKPGTTTCSILNLVSLSISARRGFSSGATSDVASPCLPARPVRPMRWM